MTVHCDIGCVEAKILTFFFFHHVIKFLFSVRKLFIFPWVHYFATWECHKRAPSRDFSVPLKEVAIWGYSYSLLGPGVLHVRPHSLNKSELYKIINEVCVIHSLMRIRFMATKFTHIWELLLLVLLWIILFTHTKEYTLIQYINTLEGDLKVLFFIKVSGYAFSP